MGASTLVVGALLAPAPAGAASAEVPHPTGGVYQNPVVGPNAPDPYIVRVDGVYYAYSTNTGAFHIPVWESRDLATWTGPTESLPAPPSWAAGTLFYWAPGVLAERGHYTMFYAVVDQTTSGQACISAATAPSPLGPFIDTSDSPVVCQTSLGGSIDPSPFVDSDGTAWLVWKSDGDSVTCGCPSSLWSQRLARDRTSVVGVAHRLLTVAERWEQPLIEGPDLHRAGNAYYLLYAANWWYTPQYAIGIATCASPAGPCARLSVRRPFVETAGAASGPGGPVTFRAFGQLWLGYHAWITGAVGTAGSGRATRIDRLDLSDTAVPSSDAPTTAPQRLRAHRPQR